MKVAILGAGSWGTALGMVLTYKNIDMTIWSRSDKQVVEINEEKTNRKYLSDIVLPSGFVATTDMEAALYGADIVLMAVPSQSLNEVIGLAKNYILPSAIIVNVAKGIELDSLRLMSEVVFDHCPNHKFVSFYEIVILNVKLPK